MHTYLVQRPEAPHAVLRQPSRQQPAYVGQLPAQLRAVLPQALPQALGQLQGVGGGSQLRLPCKVPLKVWQGRRGDSKPDGEYNAESRALYPYASKIDRLGSGRQLSLPCKVPSRVWQRKQQEQTDWGVQRGVKSIISIRQQDRLSGGRQLSLPCKVPKGTVAAAM